MEVLFFNLSLRRCNPMEIMNSTQTSKAATGRAVCPLPLDPFKLILDPPSLKL